MQITIDISKTSKDQALAVIAQLNRAGVAYEIGAAGAALDTAEPSAPPAKAPAKPRERKPRAPKADSGGGAALLEAVEQTDGSVSAITSRLGDSPSKVQRALKKLREDGAVFMAGERRFARYGLTAEQAAQRSESAQGKP